jgi:photosystem II stability/assembly factor-like uncharacterized protein
MFVFTRLVFFSLILLFSVPVFSQAPTITSSVGYPVGKSAKQVAYGNGKYVLLSEKNMLFQSTDAQSWSRIAASGLSSNGLNYLIFEEGNFIVVGNAGTIQTSADGITWTSTVSGTTSDLYRIYHFNGKFFILGKTKTFIGSDDGLTWSNIVLNVGPVNDDLNSMAYGNGVYIISSRGGGLNNIYRSATGLSNSWSFASEPMGFNSINRVQFLNDKFFAFHSGNDMFSSTNGITWTKFSASTMLTQPDGTVIPWGTGHQIFNGLWDGTNYKFFGSSAFYKGYGSNFTSSDGVNFTLENKSAYIVPQQSEYINGLYLVLGNEGIVSSTDGVVYKHSGGSFTEVVKTSNKYVAIGLVGSSASIYSSTDFQNWTDRSPGIFREMYTVGANGSVLIAGGYYSLLKSTDEGDSWTSILDGPKNSYYAIAYGEGKFVVGGYDDDNGAFIKVSEDNGDSWTVVNTDGNWYYRIRYINGKFFALGYNENTYLGSVMYSEDGTTWTEVTPPTAFNVMYYKDVVFDGTNYHVYGVEMDENWAPGSFFTLSTSTPQNSASYGNKAVISNVPAGVTLGGTWDEGVLLYSNGIFTGSVVDVVTGQDYIIYSNDGTSYTAMPQETYAGITAGVVEGNDFNLVARSNGFFSTVFPSQLPVTYNYFRGVAVNKTSRLTWSTSSENGSKGFEVMHSSNGSDWKEVGFVSALSGNTAQKTYGFDHINPVEGINYYKLVQVDVDGKKSAGKIITLTFGSQSGINVYPNPVLDYLNIRNDKNLPGQVKIFNAAGQPVIIQKIQGTFMRINMAGFKSGLYHVEISTSTERKTVAVFKN